MSWTISEILKPFTKLAVMFCLNTLLLNSTKPTLLNSNFTRNSLTLSNEFLWAPKCQIIYYLLVTNCFVYLYSCTDQDPRYSSLRLAEAQQVQVYTDAEFLSGPEQVRAEWQRDQLAETSPQAMAIENEGEGEFTLYSASVSKLQKKPATKNLLFPKLA